MNKLPFHYKIEDFVSIIKNTNSIFVTQMRMKMISIKIAPTADGSHTLFSEKFNAHYHSTNGAIQESYHVFVKSGFESLNRDEISILEIGFGTGLNAALTASKAKECKIRTHYTGIDLYPPAKETLVQMNYKSILNKEESDAWVKIISAEWNNAEEVNEYFRLEKISGDFIDISITEKYDLVYFDAFAPNDQPEMWSSLMFTKLYHATNPKGILVTYCSKGIVKQALRDAGYFVKRLPGPPGKRHILKAIKQ
jgi:tRNA U34 5-methylaminomethyl-2-thiouridine-forming methyltransferase MnmC